MKVQKIKIQDKSKKIKAMVPEQIFQEGDLLFSFLL